MQINTPKMSEEKTHKLILHLLFFICIKVCTNDSDKKELKDIVEYFDGELID